MVTIHLVKLGTSQRALPGVGRLDREKTAAIMSAPDRCNRRGTVIVAAAGLPPARAVWVNKSEMRSLCYLWRLDELPTAGTA